MLPGKKDYGAFPFCLFLPGEPVVAEQEMMSTENLVKFALVGSSLGGSLACKSQISARPLSEGGIKHRLLC